MCFEPKYEGKNWEDWLLNLMPTKGVLIDTKTVLVEGESAGGNAAVVALFLNADRKNGTKIPIRAALLRYPMLAHYKREFGDSDPIHYMGKDYPKAQLSKQVLLILAERDRLQAMGYLSTRGNSSAPKNMASAMLMSVTKEWETSFKRAKPGQSTADPFVNKDCIERARESVDVMDADLLPAIYIYHGGADTNCPVKDTEEFVGVLRKNYPTAYTGDRLILNILPKMTHGFDYDIAKTEAFLELAYTFLNKHWLGI